MNFLRCKKVQILLSCGNSSMSFTTASNLFNFLRSELRSILDSINATDTEKMFHKKEKEETDIDTPKNQNLRNKILERKNKKREDLEKQIILASPQLIFQVILTNSSSYNIDIFSIFR